MMVEVVHSNGVWKLHPPRAELRSGSLAGDVDITHPEVGLNRLSISDQAVVGRILGVRSADSAKTSIVSSPQSRAGHEWSVGDCYVRGVDLVATYQPREDWPYTTQIYWSAIEEDITDQALGSLSLFVSLQTHLLDTWPALSIQSQLVADEVVFVADNSSHRAHVRPLGNGDHILQPAGEACCVLQRLAGAPLSYAEIMPSSDFRQLTVRCAVNDARETSWELFAEFLEKGVIRSARMQAAFLPRESDIEAVTLICQRLTQQRLPLTT